MPVVKTKKKSTAAKRSAAKSIRKNREPAIRTLMMPRDTNPLGSIFGGHILSLLDLAATQYARTVSPRKYVTKVIREVDFIAPVHVGDVVSFYAETVKLGHTSITIRVDVESVRGVGSLRAVAVTSAEVVMVAIDDNGQAIPLFDEKPR
jgi:acyl-CoA thioesterase YciA